MNADSALKPAADEDLLALRHLSGPDAIQGFLLERQHLVSPAIVEQLAELVRQRLRVDVEDALRLSEAALGIARLLSDPASLGRAFRAKANALWFKGDCRAAVELFSLAIGHFEQADMPAELGRTLSSSIQPLLLLGEYDRALEAAGRARQIFHSLGDSLRLARLEINVANILHRQDRFAGALAAYERAYQELLPHKDAEGIGVALHNMAVCLIMLNDFERALACYQRVRNLCEESGMPLLALQAEYNIAYLYFLRGDYSTALERLRQTRAACEKNGDPYHAALCDLDRAEIYVELNLSGEALRDAESAAKRFEALGMGFETGRSLANLAIAHHQQGDSGQALELFAQARGIFEREDNQAWQALIDLYRALVYCEAGDPDRARPLCLAAREFFASARLDRRMIYCDLLLARLSLEAGDPAETRSRCEGILRMAGRPGPARKGGEDNLETCGADPPVRAGPPGPASARSCPARESVDAPLLAFQAHLLQGRAEQALGSCRAAYRSYRRARAELETLRACVQGEELKISFLKNKLDVYESLVDICLRQNSSRAGDRTLRYIEQAKSRSLAETVFGPGNQVGWPDAEGPAASRLRELRGELNWYYRLIETEQTTKEGISIERISSLRAEARRKEDEFLRALRERQASKPRAGVAGATASMEPEQIRAALPPETVLIEYFSAGSEFLAAVVDRRGARIVRLAPVAQVSARLRMLEFQLSKFRPHASYTGNFEAVLLAATRSRLRELYRDLIAPLAPLLEGTHLVVAPHGILHYLPFHALLDGSEYLIDRFTLSLAPSGSIYAMCQQATGNPTGPSLLMGVPDRRAPCIEGEIASVAAIVEAPQVYIGEEATSERLRSVGATSRMIHIATHGLFRRDNPMFSGVRLADGYLSLYDLYELQLPVDLLTLSGCGTGLSTVAAGDELLGIMRGLLCAGARTLLLSLWDLFDETTAGFMTSFYSQLRHEAPAGALRTAMLRTRENHPHPYYWAPFVLVGKAGGAAR